MSRSTITSIKCDRCGFVLERSAASVDFVAREAEGRGWSVDDNHRPDLCPDCAEREGDS